MYQRVASKTVIPQKKYDDIPEKTQESKQKTIQNNDNMTLVPKQIGKSSNFHTNQLESIVTKQFYS